MNPPNQRSQMPGQRLVKGMMLQLTLLAFLLLIAGAAMAQGITNHLVLLDRSISPGVIGNKTYQSITSGTTLPTNIDTIVIGNSTYAVLTPTTNAILELSATTTDSNGIVLAVFSREFLYTFVTGSSSLSNETGAAAVTFNAVAGVTYDIQLTGTGNVSFNFGLGTAPAFIAQPSSEIVPAGCPLTLFASTSGIPEPAFQWQFNDADIPGATNATLNLGNAAVNQSGKYRLRSSNAFGVALSPEAVLTIISPKISAAHVAADQSFQFTVTGLAQHLYAIEYSTDLANWTTFNTLQTGADGTLLFTDNQAGATSFRFFRARAICN